MLLVELSRNVDGYVLSTWITCPRMMCSGWAPWDYNGALEARRILSMEARRLALQPRVSGR